MPTLAPRTSQKEIDALLEGASAVAADRRKKKRARQKKILVGAVVGSILLHLILVPLLSWVVAHWPRKPMRGSSPFQLSIVRSGEEEAKNSAQTAPTQKPYMRTTAEQETDKPVEKEDFESDRNTVGASDQPPDPNKPPVPSQQGREIPTYDFDTTPYRPGREASEAASAAAASQASQQTAPAPNQTPQPENPSRNPDSKARPTPRSAQPTPTPRPGGELALAKTEPTPADRPPEPEATPTDSPPPPTARRSTSPASAASSATNSVNSTGLPRPPGYQPQTIQSKMVGSINNRGRPAVTAKATPLGRYQKAVQDAIGSVWYNQVERQLSTIMTSSEVRLHFYVTRAGVVRGVRVSKGDENSSLASISFGSITQAPIAPMPAEVAAVLPGGELEVDMGFALYTQ